MNLEKFNLSLQNNPTILLDSDWYFWLAADKFLSRCIVDKWMVRARAFKACTRSLCTWNICLNLAIEVLSVECLDGVIWSTAFQLGLWIGIIIVLRLRFFSLLMTYLSERACTYSIGVWRGVLARLNLLMRAYALTTWFAWPLLIKISFLLTWFV